MPSCSPLDHSCLYQRTVRAECEIKPSSYGHVAEKEERILGMVYLRLFFLSLAWYFASTLLMRMMAMTAMMVMMTA